MSCYRLSCSVLQHRYFLSDIFFSLFPSSDNSLLAPGAPILIYIPTESFPCTKFCGKFEEIDIDQLEASFWITLYVLTNQRPVIGSL